MDKEKVLKEIQSCIKSGNIPLASQQIMALADSFSNDPFTLLTCASLLKVIGEEKRAGDIAGSISSAVRDEDRLEVAKGLRGIGFAADAEKALSGAERSAEVTRERMRILFDMRKYAETIDSYGQLTDPTLEDEIVMIRSLSSINEHVRAADLAKALLAEAPDLLGVQKCYCSVLSSAGRSKEAEKFVKDNLKKNKSSPDADALASYLLWIEGKTTSAGAYAAKAVKGDPNNTTAMEILAYCLVEKGKTSEAKIVAGAINEKEPGNPAVVRILDMCRISG